MTKRQEKKEQRRNEILMASLDLFVRKGYGSTRVDDIAKNSNISLGLLFHYFKTKEELYNELLKIAFSSINIDFDTADSPIAIFENILKNIFDMLIHQPREGKLFVLLGEAFRSEGIPDESKKFASQVTTISQSIPVIQKGQQLGEIKQGDPLSLALVFWDAVQGFSERAAMNPETPLPEIE